MIKREIQIVGRDSVPQPRKGRYAFLSEYERCLKPGQVIRLVIPEKDRAVVRAAWGRIVGKGKNASREFVQRGGSVLLYLWIKGGEDV